ncbi:thioredoxin [Acholeplasma laidlawii]|jgi:thioredoxin 1|uniref:Thioredoxin n=2 Tax=Acholeplasma laidlawii TaxID=2148 RepID=A9NGE7_ACHLI|nr:thioredoxin [Acholeplasma laidlawii]ABX81427.1 thioredoxin [Acholeplasma laidlawii PG-8A]MBG0762181.1 thioredoxin [Acholeplasma laidlawii]NWH09997.1 thioredoxin [Acholeplasma laidlawii]NWH11387.1 thioredoxin [Acholeplasma laidlawii]NWH13203.1 thioredoxin [Acholeplasma laidlawii]
MQQYKGEDFKGLVSKDGLVLVDFFATWCGPCKMLMPVLEQISTENVGAQLIKLDIDEYRKEAIDNGIRAVPTLVLFKDGKEVSRASGYQPREKILSWIEEHK